MADGTADTAGTGGSNGSAGTRHSGWYPDPGNPRLERYFDGTRFTEYTQKAPRQGGGSGSGGRRALTYVLIGFLAMGAGALIWYLVKGSQDLAEAESNLVTQAPAAANAAALMADLRNLQIQVTTTVVDTGGAVPTVRYEDGSYVVSDGTTPVAVGAAQGVASAGIQGAGGEDWCVWVTTVDGQTWHATASGDTAEGEC